MLPSRVLRYSAVDRLVKGLSGLCAGATGTVVVVVVVVVVDVGTVIGTVLVGGPLSDPAFVANRTKPARSVTGITLRKRRATSPPALMVRVKLNLGPDRFVRLRQRGGRGGGRGRSGRRSFDYEQR